MKNKSIKSWRAIISLLLIVALSGCGEMLDNPTIDKDTGEDITLLLVDFNFFTTRVSYKFIDADDNSVITKPAKIWFTGTHANDIVDYGGEKNADYQTSLGQIELTVDPNLVISTVSPMEYAVHVEVDGYLPFTQGIQISTEGLETFELLLTKESNGDDEILDGEEDGDDFIFSFAPETTKSAQTEDKPYSMEYRISKIDLLKCLDINEDPIFEDYEAMMTAAQNSEGPFLKLNLSENNPIKAGINRMNIDGSSQMVFLEVEEYRTECSLIAGGQQVYYFNGATIKQTVSHDEPEPDIFGFIKADDMGYVYLGQSIIHDETPFSFMIASASLDPVCPIGASISFTSDVVSSFSFKADIYDDENNFIATKVFEGDFPETFTLKNMPAKSATLKFSNTNNPSFEPIEDVSIENLCSGNTNIQVNAASGYNQYQVVLIARCSESQVAVAPTYRGEIKVKGSNDWQKVLMNSGKANILAKPNEDYEIRLLWNDAYETANFSTEFDANGNYVNKTDYNITSEKMDDGRIRIKIDHTFDQDICDDINW